MRTGSWVLVAVLMVPALAGAQAPPPAAPEFRRTEDVIYGRKYGTALTMDVYAPAGKGNGRGAIWAVSGGWVSAHEAVPGVAKLNEELLRRGYTVFAVVHGSQPKYTIPEVLQDMHRAVRYIRSKAADYGIDPEKIGIAGGSAGGHLSLMQGTAGNAGKPDAPDPVDRLSSRVQAVAAFFPPTDFLNYGETGKDAIGRNTLKDFAAPFDFHELVKSGHTGKFEPVTDEAKILEIGRQISPVTHVTPDDPPTLILHGDADLLVPIQQAKLMMAKLEAAKVPCRLVVKPGAAHGWPGLEKDMVTVADWFDEHLKGGAAR